MPETDTTSTNATTLRECFSAELLKRIASPASKPVKRAPGRSRKKASPSTQLQSNSTSNDTPTNDQAQDAEELAEYIDYLSSELFSALPSQLQTLSYTAIQADPRIETLISSPSYPASLLPILPPHIIESLTAYSLLPSSTSSSNLLTATLSAYIAQTTSPPPLPSSTRSAAQDSGCEICGRDWVPLTYHHLIPKSTHERVLKRGWHPEHELQSVAWLCRACHSYVHSIESNEVLARDYFTVERLLERDDVRRWAGWVGRVRWKAR